MVSIKYGMDSYSIKESIRQDLPDFLYCLKGMDSYFIFPGFPEESLESQSPSAKLSPLKINPYWYLEIEI
jgi:hypothetical protein